MSLHDDLLAQAEHLATREAKRPKQVSLRRAVSAAYYALFHLLTAEATRLFVKDDQLVALINRVYDHTELKKVSTFFSKGEYPQLFEGVKNAYPVGEPLKSLAKTFLRLQQARHEADYDLARRFSREEVVDLIGNVTQAFQAWQAIRKDDLSRMYLACFLVWKDWNKPPR
jgi:uncharacterized protein (UPF0332 family)